MGLKGFQGCEPLGDYLLVRLHEHKKTAGDIIIPETASQSLPPWEEVVAIGPDVKAAKEGANPRINVGDCIYAYQGASFRACHMEGEVLFLMREEQVMAKVVGPAESNLIVVPEDAEVVRCG